MRALLLLGVLGWAIFGASLLPARTPWTLPEGSSRVFAQISLQTADQAWVGGRRIPLGTDLEQRDALASVEHGLRDGLTLDLLGGHVRSTLLDQWASGRADTRLGATARLLDEFASDHPLAVTVAARLGVIVQGNYPVGGAVAPGDGASGAEASVSLGRFFSTGSSVYLEAGYRRMSERVPDALFYSGGFNQPVVSRLSLNAGLAGQVSFSGGPDIFAAGFTPDRFPAVRENFHRADLGAAWKICEGGALLLTAAQTYAGRNTPRRAIVSATMVWEF